jgi:hypothetical protein
LRGCAVGLWDRWKLCTHSVPLIHRSPRRRYVAQAVAPSWVAMGFTVPVLYAASVDFVPISSRGVPTV